MLKRRPGDPEHNAGWSAEELAFFKRNNDKIDEKTARYMVTTAGGFLFAVSIFIPGDELIWGPLLAAKGWKVAKGGKKLLDKAGNVVSKRKIKLAIEKARNNFNKLDDEAKKLINEASSRSKSGKRCTPHDGKPFQNREGYLPKDGKYREYHPAGGKGHKDKRRVIIDEDGNIWYFPKLPGPGIKPTPVIVPGPG